MRELKAYLILNQVTILTWIAGLLLTLQVLNIHSFVVAGVNHRAIIGVNDDDASWNVGKAVKTRWYKDNGWVLYGPAYFRVAHTIQYFWNGTADSTGKGQPHEIVERTAHHAIMTMSLLSVLALSLLTASVMVIPWWQRFLIAFGLVTALFADRTWAEFLLRAHPDHLLTFVMAAALLFTVRMFQEPSQKSWFFASAVLWGITASIKLTVGLCAPGFLFLFVPPFSRERFSLGLKFLGVLLAAYFVIGFPQSIVLGRLFRSIGEINGLAYPVTAESIVNWFKAYGTQLWRPALVLFLAWLAFPLKRHFIDRASLWRVAAFVFLPFGILLTKNMMVPSAHYVIPFGGVLIFFLAYNLGRVPQWRPERKVYTRAALVFAAFLAVFGGTPMALQSELNQRQLCRAEAQETYAKIVDEYYLNQNIWVDPYVPFLTSAPKDRVEMTWEKSWESLEKGNWTVLAFNLGYLRRFTGEEVSEAVKKDVPGWKAAREFYIPFDGKDLVTSPSGKVFRRIYQNACSHEIWKLEAR